MLIATETVTTTTTSLYVVVMVIVSMVIGDGCHGDPPLLEGQLQLVVVQGLVTGPPSPHHHCPWERDIQLNNLKYTGVYSKNGVILEYTGHKLRYTGVYWINCFRIRISETEIQNW